MRGLADCAPATPWPSSFITKQLEIPGPRRLTQTFQSFISLRSRFQGKHQNKMQSQPRWPYCYTQTWCFDLSPQNPWSVHPKPTPPPAPHCEPLCWLYLVMLVCSLIAFLLLPVPAIRVVCFFFFWLHQGGPGVSKRVTVRHDPSSTTSSLQIFPIPWHKLRSAKGFESPSHVPCSF